MKDQDILFMINQAMVMMVNKQIWMLRVLGLMEMIVMSTQCI